MKIIGRSGNHLILNHAYQTLIVDLDVILTCNSGYKDVIGVSFPQGDILSQPGDIKRFSVTGSLIMKALSTVVLSSIKEPEEVGEN